MANKLRTLKDLKDIDFAADNNNVIYGFSEVLKQEAIEWIKEMKGSYEFCFKCGKEHSYAGTYTEPFSCSADYGNGFISNADNSNDIGAVITAFKHFFNITEEELKDAFVSGGDE